MKKVFVFFVIGFIFFGACSAQNANAQSGNNEQRIIGTWGDNAGNTWVFNNNGTLSVGGDEHKFGFANAKLFILESDGTSTIYNINMSSDGRTIILEYSSRSGNTSSVFQKNYWFTKR